jgi:hypothetical protein
MPRATKITAERAMFVKLSEWTVGMQRGNNEGTGIGYNCGGMRFAEVKPAMV